MKALGITAEYNPFHKGHAYHLTQSMERTGADLSIAVISGNFTQRGEPALLDKWTRAEMAVKNGINLVVEMPVLFAANNAGMFSSCGVNILENLGASWISFGCETGDEGLLKAIAGELRENREEIENEIKEAVKDGFSYPKARGEVLRKRLGKDLDEVLNSPNNILAIEYLKSMNAAEPVMITRKGAGYNQQEAEGDSASATAIRSMLSQGKNTESYVPEATKAYLEKPELRNETELRQKMFELLKYRVLSESEEHLNGIYGAEEGLGSKLKNEIRYASSLDDLTDRLKSRRYTRTRISRVLVSTLLGITKDDVNQAECYIRVLAFDEKGSRYLKEVKKSEKCRLPLITNINKEAAGYPEICRTLEKDILASDIYNILTDRDSYDNSDYVKKVVSIRHL